jgi:hypothetical protein
MGTNRGRVGLTEVQWELGRKLGVWLVCGSVAGLLCMSVVRLHRSEPAAGTDTAHTAEPAAAPVAPVAAPVPEHLLPHGLRNEAEFDAPACPEGPTIDAFLRSWCPAFPPERRSGPAAPYRRGAAKAPAAAPWGAFPLPVISAAERAEIVARLERDGLHGVSTSAVK